MNRYPCCAICLALVFLATGCNDGAQGDAAARKAAAEQAAEQEKVQREREHLAAEQRQQDELKKDFELLRDHWDHPGGTGPDGRPLPSIHLEITANEIARVHIFSGFVDSWTECPIRLTCENGERRLVLDDSAHQLKLTTLTYRLAGDKLTLSGSATDVLLKEVNLSGEWRRTDWKKKTEAEIADALTNLDAHLLYDQTTTARPIVQVSFGFQAPVHDEHLRMFAGLTRLEDLDLSAATDVTDAGLKHLGGLRQLRQLNLTNLPVSDQAVQQLALLLPNCRITR
jgi:hypothetical protein